VQRFSWAFFLYIFEDASYGENNQMSKLFWRRGGKSVLYADTLTTGINLKRSDPGMTKTIDRYDHTVILGKEVVEPMGMKCSECQGTPDELLVFYTMRGSQRRTHNGAFCTKLCHDRFHGLKPRKTA
jgi:hypothetical protein